MRGRGGEGGVPLWRVELCCVRLGRGRIIARSKLFDIRDAMWILGRRRLSTEAEGRDVARDQSLKRFDAFMNRSGDD